MRGAVAPQIVIALISLTSIIPCCWGDFNCDGTPLHPGAPRSSSDNRFTLKISGNPNMYVPGEKYSVSLQSTKQHPIPEKFVAFALTAESSVPSLGQLANVGNFQLYGDALTKFSDKCPNMVIQAATSLRSEVTVHWTAPPTGSGCVLFRATVIEHKDLWFMHDGLLSRTICEDIQDNLDEQPDALQKCCACDEAKYEVTFEGLWSRNTHPKDFPPNGWLTRFSDVIGASHTYNYKFWEYGGYASEGLREVAERGWTRMLESELKAESESIRTIIKARGISYPNVTGKTFAVFRVDRKHHLMSLVSMIVPSPDWIVGVSGLELCLRNCSWVEFKVLNLKPWDVGTDSGMTYTSPDSPTTPREAIRRISSKYPADEANPFHDPSGEEMKPLARLYITRQRLYEKSCTDESISTDDEDSSQSGDCAVEDWQPWSECSVTCGKGTRRRQRNYINTNKAEIAVCNRELTIHETCYGPRRCNGEHPLYPGQEYPREDDPLCGLTDWGPWSSCSATCGRASMTRNRGYILTEALKRCGGKPGAPDLQETIPCDLDDCDGEDHGDEDDICPEPLWTEWAPCSVTCGAGFKTRTSRRDGWRRNPLTCPYVPRTERVECYQKNCTLSGDAIAATCLLPADVGSCHGRYERFYFDRDSASCRGFIYHGCKGNTNKFLTRDDCEATCSSLVAGLKLNRTKQLAKYGVKLSAVVAYHVPIANEYGTASPDCDPTLPKSSPPDDFNGIQPGSQVIDADGVFGVPESVFTPSTLESTLTGDGPIDCQVSKWTRWSHCSVSCGKGFRRKTRRILTVAKNGGKCNKRLERTRPCGKMDCDTAMEDQPSIESSDELRPTWGDASPAEIGDCIMGKWGPWSSCSATCGSVSSQMRSRKVLLPSTDHGRPCGDRVEVRLCNFLPCKP